MPRAPSAVLVGIWLRLGWDDDRRGLNALLSHHPRRHGQDVLCHTTFLSFSSSHPVLWEDIQAQPTLQDPGLGLPVLTGWRGRELPRNYLEFFCMGIFSHLLFFNTYVFKVHVLMY